MPSLKKDIIVKNPQGLHARPAALFVQIASKYNSEVTILHGEERVNGRSIMGILTLGAHHNTTVTIEVEGEDASKVMEELETLLTTETHNE